MEGSFPESPQTYKCEDCGEEWYDTNSNSDCPECGSDNTLMIAW